MFSWPIIHRLDNQFGNFTVEELDYEGRRARVLFSGPLRAAQSGIPLDNNPRLLFDYNQRFLELSLVINPKKVLILGGGTLTLANALLLHLPNAKLTVVEKNKDLIKIAESYFGYKTDKRLRLVIADAKDFMVKTQFLYDLIIVDIYDDFVIPESFRGGSFAQLLGQALMPSGLVMANCIAGLYGESALPLRQLVAAYSHNIGKVVAIQADNQYQHWSPQNLIVMSSRCNQIDDAWLKGCVRVPKLDIVSSDLLD